MKSNPDTFLQILNFRVMHQLNTGPEELNSLSLAYMSDGYRIILDPGGKMLGYVVYCKVCKYSIRSLINNGVIAKYRYEWSGGRLVYLESICARFNDYSSVKNWIFSFIKEHKYIFYVRKNSFFYASVRKNKLTIKKLYEFGNV